jgi:predicted dehydrogenase
VVQALSILICGAGQIAHRFDTPTSDGVFTHVKGYVRHGGFRMAAIIDGDVERAKEAAETWNIPHYGTCLDDVRGMQFDGISICTPDHTHGQYLRDVLAFAPTFVFCEKPLSVSAGSASIEEASELVELYTQRGVHLAVNYSRRWLMEFQELSKQAQSGAFGKVVSARIKYYKGFLHNASHFLDLLQMLTSCEAVSGGIVQSIPDYTPDDPTLSLATRMKSAISGGSTFACMIEGYDSRQMSPLELEIIFENTSVKLEELSGSFLTIAKLRENSTYAGFHEFSEREISRINASSAMTSAIAALHNAVRHGTPLASTGASALETLRLCTRMQSFPTL